ncbi:hypothetical protein Tco_0369235 [Tanacetum coccineum]
MDMVVTTRKVPCGLSSDDADPVFRGWIVVDISFGGVLMFIRPAIQGDACRICNWMEIMAQTADLICRHSRCLLSFELHLQTSLYWSVRTLPSADLEFTCLDLREINNSAMEVC